MTSPIGCSGGSTGREGASAPQTGLSSASRIEPASAVSPVPASIPSAGGFLADAILAGKEQGKMALYFGCIDTLGHVARLPNGKSVWDPRRDFPGFPWSESHLDCGLLKNGKHPDVCDGKVYWTAGGRSLWYAFFWWDRSKDTRGASNSGFYVRGFGWPEAQQAFDYACAAFPKVVAGQAYPLVLQGPVAASAIEARRAETAQTGSVHESAGPQDDAQTASDTLS